MGEKRGNNTGCMGGGGDLVISFPEFYKSREGFITLRSIEVLTTTRIIPRVEKILDIGHQNSESSLTRQGYDPSSVYTTLTYMGIHDVQSHWSTRIQTLYPVELYQVPQAC